MAKKISSQTEKSVKKLTTKFRSKKSGRFISPDKKESTDEKDQVNIVGSDNKTASKIVPLPEDDGFMDMLSKMYTFMKRSYESDVLRREKESNFREERELEDQRRHDRLMEVIKKALKDRKDTVTTIEKIEENSSSMFDTSISEIFRLVNKFFKSAFGKVLLRASIAGTAAAAFIALLKYVREEDKKERPQDYENVPYDVAKQTGETMGEVGQRQRRQAVKQVTPKYARELLDAKPAFSDSELVEETGLTRTELEEELRKNPKKNIMVPVAPKATPVKEQPKEPVQQEQSSTVVPPVATPMPIPTAGDKLNQVVAENVDNKIEALVPNEPTSTINNVVAATKPRTVGSIPRIPVPPVRNTETTYQQMIYYSTRVV